jgi:hypothetical protein
MTSWNKLSRGSALAALAMALAAPVAVHAQEITATLRGDITSAGAPVSGATITVTHMPSGTRVSGRTDASGGFSVSGLRAGGPFRVDVSAPGYQTTSVTDVFLNVAQPFSVSVELAQTEVAGETVVVTASAVGRARGDGTATGLRRDALDAVTAITRDLRDVARRSPLVTANTVGDGGISIAGSNPRTNRITIDGVQAQDDFGLNTGGLPTRRGPISLDAISQVNISPAPFDVRNGGFLGGAIDVVLRSGDNEFDGSVFANFLSDDLTGSRIRNTRVQPTVEQDNWGGTFRGPILKDRLFFALSYETFTSSDTTARGPAGGGFANTVVGPTGAPMTASEISAVTSVFTGIYGSTYPIGTIPNTKPIEDEKTTLRLDWNITDAHRASFTYRNAESTVFNFTNLTATSASLDSMWYFTGEQDETYSAELNSDWTEIFSTEVRVSLRDYTRLQEPPAGQNFADISVCSTPTSLDPAAVSFGTTNCRSATGTPLGVVRFGPDQFRHANYLTNNNLQASAEGRLELGDHNVKFGAQFQERQVFNLFVPNSDGTYYFDSIADFAAGRANRLIYQNHPSGDPDRAVADFSYSILGLYVQDAWQLTDTFRVTGGLRYETYASDDTPALNEAFRGRYGFTNQTTYDGLDIVMPRVSFNWDPVDAVRVSGGFGLFSGGLPDVLLSNSFSNTGVLTAQVEIVRNADGTFSELGSNPNFTQAIGALALNGLATADFGRSVPAAVVGLLGGLTPNPGNETISIAPDFEIPAEWKANLSVQADLPLGLEGGLDLVYTQVDTGYAFRDLRATPLIVNGQVARTPDGRIRYDGLSSSQRTAAPGFLVTSSAPVGGAFRDVQLYNPGGSDLGDAFIGAVSLSRDFDFGLSASVAYTFSNITELNNSGRFGTTAGSLYGNMLSGLDPNAAVLGDGQEEIENAVKYSLEWRGTPFRELETRVSLFGDWRDGRPFSWLMNGGSGRNATFGVNKAGQLAYIPDLTGTASLVNGSWVVSSDSRVAFDSEATINTLRTLISTFGLPQGQIIDRSFNRNADIHQLDIKISQELPGLREGDKSFITFEVANFLNMLNEDWGVVEEYGEFQTLYAVSCADATGAASSAGAVTCNRYRITSPSSLASAAPTRNIDRSRWQIQVGLRYEF